MVSLSGRSAAEADSDQGFVRASVIEVGVFGVRPLLYHRSGFHFPQWSEARAVAMFLWVSPSLLKASCF